jgi:hypothetical protein
LNTFDHVTEMIQACGVPRRQAVALTNAVDGDGLAVLATGGIEELVSRYGDLYTRGLLISVVPSVLHDVTESMVAALQWLLSTGAHDGLRRVIVETLLLELSTLPPSRHPALISPEDMFTNELQFPQSLPGLEIYYSLSPQQRDTLPALMSVSEIFRMNAAGLKNSLSLLIASSPYASKGLQEALNSLVLVFQHDTLFKIAFTQTFTLFYPNLLFLYCNFIGTERESLFGTSVQVFTAASMADLMSSEGVERRLVAEAHPVHAVTLFIQSITAMLMLNSLGTSNFLSANILDKGRLRFVLRDLDYLLANASTTRVLLGTRDRGAIEAWMGTMLNQRILCITLNCPSLYLDTCLRLQGLYPMKRRTRTHVEYTDESWKVCSRALLFLLARSSPLCGCS